MKRQLSLYSVFFLALAVFFAACNNNEPAGPTQKAKYTVIIYANNGENLEVDEERDIADAAGFLATKKDDYSVRCAVYMKYSSQEGLNKQSQDMAKKEGKPFVAGGKAGEVYFFEVGSECIDFENKEAVQYLSLPDKWIADHSSAAMYEPEYIASVLKDVDKYMPAENYILVLAGHASGWEPDEDGDYPAPPKAPRSTITDAFNEGRAIKAKELHDGIKKSGIPVCAVVFDCCLQNSIEYLSELTDVTTYTLASGHTTHGGDYGSLLKELFDAPEGQTGLKKALSNYADVYAINHKNDWEDNENDKVLMNVDFAVTEMAKMPAVWTALKSIVDYMCANVKDSDEYAIPSRQCYQYYNGSSKYDLSDYLFKMMKDGAPYAGNETYRELYNNVYYALENAIVHHAYALHYASDLPDDAEAPKLSMSINLGARDVCRICMRTRPPDTSASTIPANNGSSIPTRHRNGRKAAKPVCSINGDTVMIYRSSMPRPAGVAGSNSTPSCRITIRRSATKETPTNNQATQTIIIYEIPS